MGVFPSGKTLGPILSGLPHARGGVSGTSTEGAIMAAVFPTLVGVFPCISPVMVKLPSLPHARGGVSKSPTTVFARIVSSPRSWGCFLVPLDVSINGKVFPTLVGVFLSGVGIRWGLTGLPHARGGVSQSRWKYRLMETSSPRSWGCFPQYRSWP